MCHETESTRQLSWSTGWCILWWSPWLCWRFQTFCNCVLIWMMEKWASKDHDSRCKIVQNKNVQINDIYAILIYPPLYIYIYYIYICILNYIYTVYQREKCVKKKHDFWGIWAETIDILLGYASLILKDGALWQECHEPNRSKKRVVLKEAKSLVQSPKHRAMIYVVWV